MMENYVKCLQFKVTYQVGFGNSAIYRNEGTAEIFKTVLTGVIS